MAPRTLDKATARSKVSAADEAAARSSARGRTRVTMSFTRSAMIPPANAAAIMRGNGARAHVVPSARRPARGISHVPTSFDVVRRALAHGTVMASFNIESFGLDRLARLRPEEIDRRFDEFVELTSIS